MIPFIFTPHKFDGHKADQDNRVLYSAVHVSVCFRVPYKCWNKLLCNYLCRLTWKRLHPNGENVQQHHFNDTRIYFGVLLKKKFNNERNVLLCLFTYINEQERISSVLYEAAVKKVATIFCDNLQINLMRNYVHFM